MTETDQKIIKVLIEQNSEIIKLIREQNDNLRTSRERVETFLFIGDPVKGIAPFVTEVRDGIGDATGTIRRWEEIYQRVVWIIATVAITAGVGAFLAYKFIVPVAGN